MHHLIRPEEDKTICGISQPLVSSVLKIEQGTNPKHDLILAAVKRAGGLLNVCGECRALRILPWPKDHGETAEDKWADDDENWKAQDAVLNQKLVDGD